MVSRSEALRALTAPGEAYELVDVELYGRTCRAFRNAPPLLRDLFESTASDLPFIVYGDERLTFAGAWSESCRIGTLLVEDYGVRKGDRVAISMRNYPEWMTTFAAVTSIGAIAVAMNSLWTPEEMEYGLKDSGAKVLLADEERLARLALCSDPPAGLGVLAVRAADDAGTGARDLRDALAGIDVIQMPLVDVAPEDDATILYTSGSTGHPKGAVSCHRALVTALLSWELDGYAAAYMQGVEVPAPESQPATLLAVPLFHATGSHAVYLASYRAQRRIVSMYKWDVEQAAELIERERISSFVAPPAMTGDLVQFATRTDRDLSSLDRVGGGGAARAPEQVRGIGRTFAKAMPSTGWGMTETNAIGTVISGQEYLDRPESSGRCSAVLQLRVVDADGRELPAGKRGELLVRGTSLIRGYWNRPEATAETIVDGWLRTGDVAYLDGEGYLFIVDRIKDLVIRGGENIGCGAVEAALQEHPDVLEACVYAVPDERLGEEVGATLYVTRLVDDGEIREFLAPRLARFEIPRYLTFSTRPLPRTASGKILKRQLKQEAAARLTG
ncbi:MAG: AMP-binding protein [Pseudomonadales bacterium]|nr:acyl--CoA ligase [Pseudomonadales bacterium]NIX07425.1 AMP-binding protein [Pseudomonadales bacterium]